MISRSPNEAQPVLDTIVATAQRLCQAERAIVWRLEGETFRTVAHRGQPEERVKSVLSARRPLSRGNMIGRATLARRAVQVEDAATDPELVAADQAFSRAGNIHTLLAVPLLLKGHPIGGITLARTRVALFDDKQVALVESFADQAVIAIENSRLFEAEQASKRELLESLEYQTAISEVLGVISRSPSEVQPVLDTIAKTARRLCEADRAIILRLEKDRFLPVARDGITLGPFDRLTDERPPAVDHTSVAGRAVIEKRAIHVEDVRAEQQPIHLKGVVGDPRRTMLGVPLFREGAAVGAIVLSRTVVRPFAEQQIALLTTFADQAVIAINNVGLLEEVQARNRDLTALGEVGRAVSSTLDLKTVLKTIVERAVELSGTDAGSILYYRQDVGRFELGETSGLDDELVARLRTLDIAASQTGIGEAIANRQPLQILTCCSGRATRSAMPRSKRVCTQLSSCLCWGARVRLAHWCCNAARRATSRWRW